MAETHVLFALFTKYGESSAKLKACEKQAEQIRIDFSRMGNGNNLAHKNEPPNRLAAGGPFSDEATNFVITNHSQQETNERQVFSAYRTRINILGDGSGTVGCKSRCRTSPVDARI